MKNATYYIVDSRVLPEVFAKVVEVKQLLSKGMVGSTAEAVRTVGISRSAFYKYKDFVYTYHDTGANRIITVHAILHDRPGVLESFIGAFTKTGVNILTINQNIPVSELAVVSVSSRILSTDFRVEELLETLRALPGVERIETISGE